MADSKISGLPASTTPLAGTEVLPIVQSGATKQVSIANVTAGRAVAALSITTDTYKAASSGGGALQNASGTTQVQWGAGGGSNFAIDVAANINPANAQVDLSPTGTGTVRINPATASSMNNVVIGATTPLAGGFTTVTAATTMGVGAATPAASGAGVTFPGTQSASTDVNTLDDYEEGTFTPVVSFTTPGDVSVAYSAQVGLYTKIGRMVFISFNITCTPTFTTASGSLTISTAPFASTGASYIGAMHFSNFLFGVGYTMLNPRLGAVSSTTFDLVQSGSGLAPAAIATTNMVSGTAYILRGTLAYQTTT